MTTQATSFFSQVHKIVGTIPQGKVMTYGQIAALLGGVYSARVVVFALKQAPSSLPCHRVVNRLGEMAPDSVFGSKALQRKMLEEEGVVFTEKGHTDLEKSIFLPEQHLY